MEDSTHGWVVIVSGSAQYLGKVVVPAWCPDQPTESINDWVLKQAYHDRTICLFPAFEFYTPLAQNAQGQIKREGLTTPFQFTTHDTPVHTRVANSIVLFSEMQESDSETYKSFVEQARKHMAGARAQRAGITPAIQIPKGAM